MYIHVNSASCIPRKLVMYMYIYMYAYDGTLVTCNVSSDTYN